MEFEARKALDQKPAPECFEIEMECALYKAEVVVKYSVSLEFIITLFAILDSIPDFVYTRAACLKLRKNYKQSFTKNKYWYSRNEQNNCNSSEDEWNSSSVERSLTVFKHRQLCFLLL